MPAANRLRRPGRPEASGDACEKQRPLRSIAVLSAARAGTGPRGIPRDFAGEIPAPTIGREDVLR